LPPAGALETGALEAASSGDAAPGALADELAQAAAMPQAAAMSLIPTLQKTRPGAATPALDE
jgi:hypothetical protein